MKSAGFIAEGRSACITLPSIKPLMQPYIPIVRHYAFGVKLYSPARVLNLLTSLRARKNTGAQHGYNHVLLRPKYRLISAYSARESHADCTQFTQPRSTISSNHEFHRFHPLFQIPISSKIKLPLVNHAMAKFIQIINSLEV